METQSHLRVSTFICAFVATVAAVTVSSHFRLMLEHSGSLFGGSA